MSRRQPAEWAHAAALGPRVKGLREAAAITRAEFARRAAEHGVVWHNGAVMQIEEGTRLLSAYELTVLATLLKTPPTALLRGLPVAGPTRLNQEDEGLKRAAKSLGRTAEELDQAAVRLWGRPLHAVREDRLRADPERQTNQAHRGHVTRRLLAEVRTYLDQP